MNVYIHEKESIGYRFGDDEREILKVLAQRYIGANPPVKFGFRTFFRSSFLQTEEGLFDMDMRRRFPQAVSGQYAYSCGLVWSDNERSLDILIHCLGPVRFYFNGELAYRTGVIEEIKLDSVVKLSLDFVKGWNSLVLVFQCTAAGFGCLFGADEAKVRILNVLSPFAERRGQAGWVYSAPTDSELFKGETLPDLLAKENESGLSWMPACEWSLRERDKPTLERLFGLQPGKQAYAWCKVVNRSADHGTACVLEGRTDGPLTVWISGKQVLELDGEGPFRIEIPLSFGDHDLLVSSRCTNRSWGFTMQVSIMNGDLSLASLVVPVPVHGSTEPWLYLGPLDGNVQLTYDDVVRTDRLYPMKAGEEAREEQTYWRLDLPDAWVRPYYENAMLSNKWTVGKVTNYARWDYPLGVTIYGLLQTGRWLERPDMINYAVRHVQACTDMYEYSLWDREQYGFPAVNQQLVMMKMLDNCGSFGSAMLEAFPECSDPGFLPIAHRIAEFMLQRLERKEDGAFYRECNGEYSENTIWADDLYMSTPFLCRYARVAGNQEALEETVRQFRQFRRYLYMLGQRLMSHVFDFKYGVPTGIPWGRGNGWTLFSLTEVLEALPADHEARDELVEFFNDLCAGYADRQADSGLWHQVLNDPDAYEEASCTAMFVYAFSRGVRFDWLKDRDRFIGAALKGWNGLTLNAIDSQGNVHGVCSGSRYSFSADYYKKDLLTVTNDNHGIGIMMLAGTEVSKLKRELGKYNCA